MKKKKWMFGQRDEHPKVSTPRKKEEVQKKEAPPKNTIVAIPMKSSAIPMKSAKNDDSEGDAHKVSIFIINGCIFPIL